MKSRLSYRVCLAGTVIWTSVVIGVPVTAQAMTQSQLEGMSGLGAQARRNSVPNARLSAVKEAGQDSGAAWGYYETMRKIERSVAAEAPTLNRIYNFTPFLMKGYVLPPVIESVDQSARFNSATEAAFSRKMFRIVHPAQIVSVVPTWQGWLMPPNAKPDPVNPILLPANPLEKGVWKKAVAHGWKVGSEAAQDAETENVHRLTRTMAGMIRFMRLRATGMVQGPVVVAGLPQIKVGNQTLSVDARIIKIAQPANFMGEKHWKAEALGH